MKKRLFIACLSLLFIAPMAFAQQPAKVIPPAKVLSGLDKNYPGNPMIYSWRKIEETYLATFIHKEKYRYARFTAKGWWMEKGESINRDDIPAEVWEQVPKMDITAFVFESFKVLTEKDDKGYLIVYETDKERIDILITEAGKVLREDHYPIPAAEPLKKTSSDTQSDSVDWSGDW